MTNRVAAILLWLVTGIVMADDSLEFQVPLYSGGIPNKIEHQPTEFLARQNTDNPTVVAVDTPELTAFLPPDTARNGTAVIILPGGGYHLLAIEKEGFAVARRFASNGVSAFVLKYRMPLKETMRNPALGPLQDAQQAIKVVRQRSKEWKLDSQRIGIMGFSAGGHLAASAATQFVSPVNTNFSQQMVRPDFQILAYPVISMENDITHQGSKLALLGEKPDSGMVRRFSAEKQITKNTPQAFIVHANDDNSVPVENALRYHAALLENSVKVQMLLLPEGGHGFGMRHPVDWFGSMMEWMAVRKLVPTEK